MIPGLTTSKVLTSCTCNIPYPDGNLDYRLEYHNNILSNLINEYRKIFQSQILPPLFPPSLSFIYTGLLTKHEISEKTLWNLHSLCLFHNIHCALQLLTLFLLGGGSIWPPLVVFFYITQKVLVWGCWNFLTFLTYPKPSL